ncbi:twin-arginine translocase TatA/TatE family subunit [Pelagicoccus sp. SDUM812002]|uniref:Sec-independent protein translocase subunit TatA/TatB n=1 Tax=Pelagicoccus sp. SDUM812002 TaxID=3041266 RepID=UPI00280DD4BD|nr:twin-arginine translocase TatA/TatE family subunit [Pelagicoccus sp. SDUM812002]MDQ8184399.1 twin-arginine translocase TatA/TatE family subunit [Pelagicoccus sp. SDUM812002]
MQASNAVLGFMNMGWPEITIVIVIFILLFGAKKLPELARGVGKSIKEFKKATSNIEEEVRNAIEEEPKASAPKPSVEKEKQKSTTES